MNYATNNSGSLQLTSYNNSQVWSNGGVFSNYGRNWTYAFDGNITNYEKSVNVASPGVGETKTIEWAGNIPLNGKSVKIVAWFQDTTSPGQGIEINGTDVTNQFSGVGASYARQTRDVTGDFPGDAITSIKLSRAVGEHGQMAILGIIVGGALLVDTGVIDVGPFNTLSQSWSQWVIQTLRTASQEATALKAMLASHAQTYDAAEDYCEGSVIKAFGELWIAVNEAPATTYADIAALISHPNWERLNIEA